MTDNNILFIVGMPRSGTKLFRDLLNQHPEISIPEVETHFLPMFIKRYGLNFNFNSVNKDKLLKSFLNTTFYWNVKKNGLFTDEDFFLKYEDVKSWADFNYLIFSHFSSKTVNTKMIFGDKTPGYLNHIDLINKLHSNAKFIHINRDPRDYCLSVKNIWNKSIYRACQNWQRSIGRSEKYNTELPNNYMEIKYEDLIQNTEETQKKICFFLKIPYRLEMTRLKKSAENYGAAKGTTKVLSNNSNKYFKKLSRKELKKIEELCFDQLTRLNYNLHYGTKLIRLNYFQDFYLKLYDFVNSLVFHTKEKGIITGIKYFISLHFQSSWRK